MQKEIIFYQTAKGKNIVKNWLQKLDIITQARIISRFKIIENGNFGDFKKIKGESNLYEFRFKFGSGYRIYFSQEGSKIIILLNGGDKSSQNKDIKKASEYLEDYNNS